MISLLVVNYRTAALAADAIRTARASSSSPLQVVVVDNTCDPREAEALRAHADTLLVAPVNRGYSGGINLGRAACEGETIVATNPDVTFAAGAIDQLAAALDERTAVAGPALFWDQAHQWILPPADLTGTAAKVDEVLASRSRAWFEQRDRRRFAQRVAFWSLRETTEVRAVSGAVMAIRAADFDAIGGFDERFPLYFEEIDFLRRLSERRKRIVYVPEARCRHLYNQSAGQDSAGAAVLYAASELKYLEKWAGPFAARTMKRLERAPFTYDAQPVAGPIAIEGSDVIIEASPSPSFITAAGHFPRSATVDLPDDVWIAARSETIYLRTVERGSGRVVATYARNRT